MQITHTLPSHWRTKQHNPSNSIVILKRQTMQISQTPSLYRGANNTIPILNHHMGEPNNANPSNTIVLLEGQTMMTS